MKHAKADRHRRAKATAIAAVALVAGIGLVVLSRTVIASGKNAAAQAAESQPASEPAPAAPAVPADPNAPLPHQQANRKAAAAQRMGGLLLLFSLMCFSVAVIAIGWIVYDIRRSRPAWMTQTKYPVRERHK